MIEGQYTIAIDGVRRSVTFDQLVEHGRLLAGSLKPAESAAHDLRIKFGFLLGGVMETLPWGVRGRFLKAINISRKTASKCMKAAAEFATGSGQVDWLKVRDAVNDFNARFPKHALDVKWPKWMDSPTAREQIGEALPTLEVPQITAKAIDLASGAVKPRTVLGFFDLDEAAEGAAPVAALPELTEEQEAEFEAFNEDEVGDGDEDDDDDTDVLVGGREEGEQPTSLMGAVGVASDSDISGVTTSGRTLGVIGHAGGSERGASGEQLELDELYVEAWMRIVRVHDGGASEEFKRAIVELAEKLGRAN